MMPVGTIVRMKITSVLILVVALATTKNLATAQPLPNSNDDQMRALRKAVDDARSTFQKATNDVDYKLRGTYYHVLTETNLPQILDLAKTNPSSEAAFE